MIGKFVGAGLMERGKADPEVELSFLS